MKFNSAEEMLAFITSENGADLYSSCLQVYIFAYNDAHSVCAYTNISTERMASLKVTSLLSGDCSVSTALGMEDSAIYDASPEKNQMSNLDLCREMCQKTDDWVSVPSTSVEKFLSFCCKGSHYLKRLEKFMWSFMSEKEKAEHAELSEIIVGTGDAKTNSDCHDLFCRVIERLVKTTEKDFLHSKTGRSVAVYQISSLTDDAMKHVPQFFPYELWKKDYIRPVRVLYDYVYCMALNENKGLNDSLESVFAELNICRGEHPLFFGHSVSVSDVFVVNDNGELSAFFVDSFGYHPLTDFYENASEVKEV